MSAGVGVGSPPNGMDVVSDMVDLAVWIFRLIWPNEPFIKVVARFKEIVAPPRARAAVLTAKLFHLARLLHRGLWTLPWV